MNTTDNTSPVGSQTTQFKEKGVEEKGVREIRNRQKGRALLITKSTKNSASKNKF